VRDSNQVITNLKLGFPVYSREKKELPLENVDELRELMKSAAHLIPNQGDMIQSLSAKKCCEIYQSTNKQGKLLFLRLLGQEFGVERNQAIKRAESYIEAIRQTVSTERETLNEYLYLIGC
jgi:hypothetical protein